MSRYDGPSYYKKNHPKIKPLNKSKKDKEENKKVSWADQENYFKNGYEESLPKRVQTRTEMQQKAWDYMQTPPAQSNKKPNRAHPVDADTSETAAVKPKVKESNYRFRSKHIPTSLQHLDGWKTNTRNYELIAKVARRLEKETSSYLLFEEYLAPEVAEVLESSERAEHVELSKQDNKIKPTAKVKRPEKGPTKQPPIKAGEKPQFEEQAKQKAERVQKSLNQNLVKPNTGLHRSLSKIIAEDQEVLKTGKNNLGSLFSDDD